MTRDEQEVVSELQQGLIQRIGQERFELWFGNTVQLQPAAGQIVIRADSQFVLDRLRKQFVADLEAAGRHVLGDAPQLVFQVNEEPIQSTAELTESTACGAQRPTKAKPRSFSRRHKAATQPHGALPARSARYGRLDGFIVGSGNRIAHSAASTVCERLGAVSPLFLYGPSGCGKTHLLQGIWSSVRQQTRMGRILALSAEQFTTHFLEALRGGGLPSFRRKCRDVELLTIDDIQFFAGKRATMIELQHTVDEMLRRGRQLVLAADRPPAMLKDLGSELVARVSGGLVCGIEPADYPTRLGIARQIAGKMGMPVPEDVLASIASRTCGDARQIVGALNRLRATSEALQCPVTSELARSALLDIFRGTQKVVRLGDIEAAVCEVFGLEPKRLRESSKARSITQPRMLAMWLARKYTQAAFTEISEYFGRRSHSTVISAEKKVNRWVADGASVQLGRESYDVQDAIRRVETQLRTG